MAKSIFDAPVRQELIDRIAQLTPTHQRQWGKMTPSQMICHLMDSLRVATGQAHASSKNNRFMANPLVRWLIIYVMPWPKGKVPTVPELLLTQPSEWKADIATLSEQLTNAATRGPSANWGEHPAFGQLSGQDFGVLIYRHCNHHLTQFGV